MTRPKLLVDVDGVLNVFGFNADGYEQPEGLLETTFIAQGVTIHIPAGTSLRMSRLESLYDCIWCTTWEDKAPQLLGPHLGFGEEWPIIQFGLTYKRNGTWKLPRVKEWIKEHLQPEDKLAWIDDDLNPDAFFWMDSRPNTLLVPTQYDMGMTDEHVERLEEFADE